MPQTNREVKYGFPFEAKEIVLTRENFRQQPWSLNESFIFLYLVQGEVHYCTPDGETVFTAGQCGFVNAKVLRKLNLTCEQAIIRELRFDRRLLSGSLTSVFEKKYIMPIANCTQLKVYAFDQTCNAQLYTVLSAVFGQAVDKPFGYELHIRNQLSDIWLMLMQQVQDLWATQSQTRENEALDGMLAYIRENYAQNITVTDIANAGFISKRACYRCFMHFLGVSPVQYLTDHRLRNAMNLLRKSNESITNIALQCGFNTSSYFTQTFKKHMNCTPKEYRNEN